MSVKGFLYILYFDIYLSFYLAIYFIDGYNKINRMCINEAEKIGEMGG